MYLTRCTRLLLASPRYSSSSGSSGNLLIDNIRAALRENDKTHCTPSQLYKAIVEKGAIKQDEHQETIVQRLDTLLHDVERQRYPINTPPKGSADQDSAGGGFFSAIGNMFKPSDSAIRQSDLVYALDAKDLHQTDLENELCDPAIVGVYLHGDVGCGKTMVMDLFYECLRYNMQIGDTVKRCHFNKFMLDCHRRLHRIKKNAPPRNEHNKYKPFDVIPPLAEELMRDHWVVCFDEFQVQDIADAMIIKRLFFELWKRGLVIVVTGNRVPNDLYKNGLQYKNFEAFIPMLLSQTETHFLNSGIDYRKKDLATHGDVFILKDTENAEKRFEEFLFKIAGIKSFSDMKKKTLKVFGRDFHVDRAHKRIAMFTFEELCDRPLGAQDYLEIADHFDLIFIKDLPIIDLQTRRAEARRFITLIDNLYDNRTGTVFLSEGEPENLFTIQNTVRLEWTAEERQLMDDLKIKGTDEAAALSIISGEDEAFALARLISRLTEMKTQDYWDDVKRRMKEHSDLDAHYIAYDEKSTGRQSDDYWRSDTESPKKQW